MLDRKIVPTSLMLIALSLALAIPAQADEVIPHALLSARQQVLKDREVLLANKDVLNRKLTDLFYARKQLEKAINSTSRNLKGLQDARAIVITQTGKMQSGLDRVDSDLRANDKDLYIVETELKRFACMQF